MEAIKTAIERSARTQEAATRNGLTTQTTLLQNYGDKAKLRNKLYLADCIDLVKKLNNWANMPPLSEIDLAERAKDWQDALEVEIPRHRLPDVLRRADRNHTSTFPINKYEMSSAWREIDAEERADQLRKHAAAKQENPVTFCDDAESHVSAFGDVYIYSLFTNTDEVVPCRSCRFDDYENWRKSQVALYGEIEPLTKLQTANAKPEYINLKDPLEIINRAVKEVNNKMISALGRDEMEYENARKVWLLLMGSRRYIETNDLQK